MVIFSFIYKTVNLIILYFITFQNKQRTKMAIWSPRLVHLHLYYTCSGLTVYHNEYMRLTAIHGNPLHRDGNSLIYRSFTDTTRYLLEFWFRRASSVSTTWLTNFLISLSLKNILRRIVKYIRHFSKVGKRDRKNPMTCDVRKSN